MKLPLVRELYAYDRWANRTETRPVVTRALEMARTKKVERPWKKHGVMPV